MAQPDPDRLTTAMRDLLNASLASLADPPDRYFISAGRPVAECEAIAVWCSGVRTIPQVGDDRPAARRTQVTREAALTVTLWRPICKDPLPATDTLDGEGARSGDDIWQLVTGTIARHHDGSLFTGVADLTGSAQADVVEIEDSSGGYYGFDLTWRVTL